MSDDLKQNLRGSCYLAFEDGTNDYETAPEAADRIDELEKQNASLEAAIKRQASAARTLRSCALAEVQHLSEMDRSEYFAAHTLDSERDANAILTDRIEELEAKLAKVVQGRDEWRSLAEAAIKDDAAKNIHYAEIQAKLTAAVKCQYLNECIEMVDELYDSSLAAKARTTLAELKGEQP